MVETPFDKIKESLSKQIPKNLIGKIPDKWDKTGEVLTIKLPTDLKNYEKKIGEMYAMILNCKTVLNDIGGISGVYREPNVAIIYGSTNTETTHKENGIKYKLDPQRIMFSSGNMDERLRMANISNTGETVVDLFAGIGYFTIPMAVYSKPKKIFACEINPVSYEYLCTNIISNNVTSLVEPLKGDSRKISTKNVADRVLLGYFGNTHDFLPTAIDCLKNHTGIIHYHDKFPDGMVPDDPLKIVKKIAEKYDRNAQLLKYKHVKTYAPGISHFVLDIQIGEQ
ncbi:MAG: class I SAM-dependent methyltransferase family protein [Candidatus Thermoplasmatota archaeon]|nr:class I SAM-dependent methyltransferase family protein [Candidatus Thermoplasmatota archaeon]